MKKEFPILEYDSTREAIIEPSQIIQPINIPEVCVVTFFQEIIDKLKNGGKARQIAFEKGELGIFPVYEVNINGKKFALFNPGIGGPMVATMLEFVIALGCKKFIACGGAGCLYKKAHGKIIIPIAAIRDEGTSYHYLPPSREIKADLKAIKAIEKALQERQYEYIFTKTWTTDALYRETLAKIQLRKSEGCSVVEMETASFFAVSQFRGVQFAQILYGGDDVSRDEWNPYENESKKGIREKIF